MSDHPTPPAGRDDLREATCKHCGRPIVFKPYFADGKQRWWHPGNGLGTVTCQSRPDDYPDGEWPTAEPAPSVLQGSPSAGSTDDPDDTWTVAVEIPAGLPDAMKDSLFTAVADAAHDWEPEDRDGWDVSVTGYPTPHGAGWTEATVERVRELGEELAGLAPGDEWGESMAGTVAADVARRFLAALDPPTREEEQAAFDASPPLSGLVGLAEGTDWQPADSDRQRAEQAENAVERVRELHSTVPCDCPMCERRPRCRQCHITQPCPTNAALDPPAKEESVERGDRPDQPDGLADWERQLLDEQYRQRRLGELEAAVERVRERLGWLIANGFGATHDTLRDLRAALDQPAKEET